MGVKEKTRDRPASAQRRKLVTSAGAERGTAQDPLYVNCTGAGQPSATVVTEKAYGQSENSGVATTYSRGDHTHGTPPAPSGGVQMALGSYVGTGIGLTQDIVVGFTPDYIVDTMAESPSSGFIGHRMSNMQSAAFCVEHCDVIAAGVPGINPTIAITQPVANQFRVTGYGNIVGKTYYWVAFKRP